VENIFIGAEVYYMKTLKVGLVGCGNICDIYFQNCQKWSVLDIVACADLISARAEAKAKEYDIPKACSVDELINDPAIDIVLNLTTPQSHAKIYLAALEAGKHAYSEKPLAIDLEDGKKIIRLASQKKRFVGCAPDTFLGGRLQTCRKLIDDGWIGEPVAATAFCAFHGHEVWHPDPAFLYQKGAGPMFDMGVYYMTALISILGPVKQVFGGARTFFKERTVTSQAKYGEKVKVGTETHITGVMDFASGALGTVMMSFDVWDPHLPRIEIYGREGTIYMHEDDPYGGPNVFGGKIYFRRGKDSDWLGYPSQIPRKPKMTVWDEIPVIHGYNENSRGVGLGDMAYAVQTGRSNRASGEMAFHVLETMVGFMESAKNEKYYKLTSSCAKPEPLTPNLPDFVLEK
jgi:predicted dehydrogenase